MKKAQTEVIGLMVIVVLIIIIAVVFINLSLIKTPKPVIRENAITINLLSAIMFYKLCDDMSVAEVIAKDLEQCCNAECDAYLENEVKNIVRASVDNKVGYKLSVSGSKDFEIGFCDGEKFTSSYIHPRFNARIELCF